MGRRSQFRRWPPDSPNEGKRGGGADDDALDP